MPGPLNSRVKQHFRQMKEERKRTRSVDTSPSIPPVRDGIRRSGIITVKTISMARYFGVGYEGIRRPLIYDDLETAMAKYRKLGQLQNRKPRVQTAAHIFDEATWFSMSGPDIVFEVGENLWQWEAEGAWLLRKEQGEELSTDVSDEETPSTSQSSQEPMHQSPTAAAQPRALITIGAQSELSRAQHRKKGQHSKARTSNLAKHYQCAESDHEAYVNHRTGLVQHRVQNPRYITAMSILNELEDSENANPALREQLKAQLMRHVFSAIHDKSFSASIGDQFSHIAAQFTRETPQASSQGSTQPQRVAPEEHNIFTDEEEVRSEAEDRLDTASNIGRLRTMRESVSELRTKFDNELFGAMPSELMRARQCNLQSRGDLKEQADTLRAIKESASAVQDHIRAEEICIHEAQGISLIFPDDPSAGSSTDAAGVPAVEVPDTSNEEAIAEAMSEVEYATGPTPEKTSNVQQLAVQYHYEYRYPFVGYGRTVDEDGSFIPYPRSVEDPSYNNDG